MNGTTRARLRTKTGCLTCRRRRKKCNEKYPICERCAFSGRQCQWPTAAGLLDTRFATHDHSRYRARAMTIGSTAKAEPRRGSTAIPLRVADEKQANAAQVQASSILAESRELLLFHSESALMQGVMARDLKRIIVRHFVERYYSLILLPNCHRCFYDGWLTEMQDLMVHHKSLFYSMLACAASHIHFIDGNSQMQQLALTCYSTAIRALSKFLAKASQLENHNGLLMSVMLLYLHGCLGCDTFADIPRHVNAATRILAMRLFRRPLSIKGPFDRLAVESVLYQIFLVMTGLWSESTELDYDFDLSFWIRAEEALDQSTFFPGGSTSLNSPVLGIPVSLFRLGLLLRQQYLNPLPIDSVILDQLRNEVETWEAALLCNGLIKFYSDNEQLNSQETYYRDACYLYSIIVSVLLEQLSITTTTESISIGPAPMECGDCWQVQKAVHILRAHQFDSGWFRCFIGNWPVYTLGFLMSSPEDKDLIRADLQHRWDIQRSAQISRFQRDLERTWAARAGT